MQNHIIIYISNKESKTHLIKNITSGEFFPELAPQKGAIFSEITINRFIEQETRHERFSIKTETNNSLKNSSEGERKRALLNHILSRDVSDYLVLDNVFDCLDVETQSKIKTILKDISHKTKIIQIATRKRDFLAFIDTIYTVENNNLQLYDNVKLSNPTSHFVKTLPQPYKTEFKTFQYLVSLNNVSLSYKNKPILNNISWQIKSKEFWQLIGPNGSGKSTILSLISGDNPKGYMQDMTLFGMKKGTGETVWDIKKHIGFYSSEMLRGFKRKDTIESMIVSGFLDSIGLYSYPTDVQLKIAREWLELLNMHHIKDKSFHFLSSGHKRLVLIARAMVKHPPLLILDEPTNGLDDTDAQIFSELINKIAKESNTAIIYVSHRKEPHINPDFVYELIPQAKGSIGKLLNEK
ncbi:ATP-binding cassette domain-containing protein [Jejuia pallidilutea]|uniref:Putative molybdenum transport ATP-binding protein modF n=2 Tax=Jejuia pallidilutea TaxID=504487 RepID=A0A090W179_9FLAO|nr:ATP-binding cassette domain-containing protein [Jejuia pallidilutea]GAL70681.1 putative molybdenum transport ATP-binding protein modF [Jejuia pallidilutea]GAL90560.1 putative molybdenum transport ATP-binding protein modF [Jejuia pallidilutea]